MNHVLHFSCTMLFSLMFLMPAQAQKPDLFEGKFDALKGEKQLNLIYDYSNMSVGDFEREADYLAKRSAEQNADEPGSGDAWAFAWVSDREARFEPKFREMFNEEMAQHQLEGGDFPGAKYTLIVRTTHTEPGFNVGVAREPAHLNADLWLVETHDMSNIQGKMRFTKIKGANFWGMDFDTGSRIETAYGHLAQEFAKYLSKKVM